MCGRRRNDTLYEMRYESGRATARVAPTKGYKECDVVKNPPVTASPCQPPLGKGAEGTGVADCHSQCTHWLRNDTLYEMRYESGRATARVAPTGLVVGADGAVRPLTGALASQ